MSLSVSLLNGGTGHEHLALVRVLEFSSGIESDFFGEGNTPLLRSRRIGPAVGINNLWFKLETGNPSGSYKDRFAAAAISHMIAEGQKTCIATSSGNNGAALAAYCAAAKIRCHISVVEAAPDAKLLQMRAYGAEVIRVPGFGLNPEITSQTFDGLLEQGGLPGHALQISAYRYSPKGMAGVEHRIRIGGTDGTGHQSCLQSRRGRRIDLGNCARIFEARNVDLSSLCTTGRQRHHCRPIAERQRSGAGGGL